MDWFGVMRVDFVIFLNATSAREHRKHFINLCLRVPFTINVLRAFFFF